MDSDKLQKLANLAAVRQHAAAVTASTSFNRKYIAKVNAAIGTLDSEFANLLTELIGDSGAEDALTISQRLAEEKAKLKAKLEPTKTEVKVVEPPPPVAVIEKPSARPSIKTTRSVKKHETSDE